MKPIGASDVAKHYGFKSLVEVSEISGIPLQTLNSWFKNKRKQFEVAILGTLQLKLMGARYDGAKKIEE